MSSQPSLIVRTLGVLPYTDALARQRAFTDARGSDTADEVWVVSHAPVFTLGQAGKRHHVLDAGDIPVVQSDRGGQVTYHGPGQVVVYTLLDLRRHGLGVRALVSALEHTVVAVLAEHGVAARADPKAPGVYVNGAKIAALGLRVRRGCSYHGLALNVSLDLRVYDRINPCGYPDMAVTRTCDHGIGLSEARLGEALVCELSSTLGVEATHGDDGAHLLRTPERSGHE
ncbi:MAG: lipoyl(octanoyl) transferase LipB [Pseudomonadota bacterium]